MNDTNVVKTLLAIDVVSIISETENEDEGEANVGYQFKLNGSLPEIAHSIAIFLKMVDEQVDMKEAVNTDQPIGKALLELIENYYNTNEK